jgi:hypothetical protein
MQDVEVVPMQNASAIEVVRELNHSTRGRPQQAAYSL